MTLIAINIYMNIIQRVKDIGQSAADKFESDFVAKFKSEFPELDSSLLEITSRSHRPVTHAVYNNEHKYVSKRGIVDCFRHYRSICKREGYTGERVEDDTVIKCWKSCMTSELLPDVLEETSEMFKVSYIDSKSHRGMTPRDLHYINRNKDRIISYYDLIKNQPVCISDFNLNNFIVSEETGELLMVDLGDVDYIERFNPGLFNISSAGAFSYYICKAVTDISIEECKTHLELYLGGDEEIISIQSF